MTPPEPIASYQRRVRANTERVWENVLDWEHLPALHSASFASIRCEDAGPWGWRALVHPARGSGAFTIELSVDHEDSSYHSRTIAGPGEGTDIFTRVDAADSESTNIRVEFFVPGVDEASAGTQGRRFVELYTRLWDEDEAMMRGRQAFLDGGGRIAKRGARERIALGPARALRELGERIVEVDSAPFRVVWHEGRFAAHTAVCPHWGGPLAAAAIEANQVVCPWHGYRFDLTTGLGPSGQACRLAARARIDVDANDDAWILVT